MLAVRRLNLSKKAVLVPAEDDGISIPTCREILDRVIGLIEIWVFSLTQNFRNWHLSFSWTPVA